MTKIILNTINIEPLLKAQAFLIMGIKDAKSELEKAGAIQAFEFCYELAWKLMKRILSHQGSETASPRETFRSAAQNKLIDDPEIWFEFINKRNLTVHIYNHDIAKIIFDFLPIFATELDRFIKHIQVL